MKTILLQILHYLWSRKENIYSAYKAIIDNPNIKIDGKLNFKEFLEYSNILETSWVTKESFELDDEIITGEIIGKTLSPNNSKHLVLDQQKWPTCVPTSFVRMINYNTEINITEIKKLEYIEDMYVLWIMTKKGSHVKRVADYLRKRIKKDFGKDLTYFKETLWSKKYNELLENWYAHTLGGWMSNTYVADFRADGDIDIENYTFKEKIKYYHLFMNLPKEEAKKRDWNIVENYNKRFGIRNIYKNDFVNKFGAAKVFFNYWYFFIETHNIDNKKLIQEKARIKKDITDNRFYKHLLPHIQKWYNPIFNDYNDTNPVNAGEVKTLIDLANVRKK